MKEPSGRAVVEWGFRTFGVPGFMALMVSLLIVDLLLMGWALSILL